MEEVLRVAGVAPEDVDYIALVEAHVPLSSEEQVLQGRKTGKVSVKVRIIE